MDYILIGDSGHAKVIQDCIFANGDSIKAILDDKYEELFESQHILKGHTKHIHHIKKASDKLIIAIGNNKIREKIVSQLGFENNHYGVVIHPSAIVSKMAVILEGTVIMPNAVVNSGAFIANHCIINTNSVVEHDVLIENFVHIAPGAVIAGGSKIGRSCHIGPNATVDVLKEVGADSHILAGEVIR